MLKSEIDKIQSQENEQTLGSDAESTHDKEYFPQPSFGVLPTASARSGFQEMNAQDFIKNNEEFRKALKSM